MPLVEAFRCPISEDLSGLLVVLQRAQIPCRIAEESGEQVVWVPAAWVESVKRLYQERMIPQASLVQPVSKVSDLKAKVETFSVAVLLQELPVTVGVLFVTALVALLSDLGERLSMVHWLSFLDFQVVGLHAYFSGLEQTLSAGHWWRMFAPIFLHFGWLHWVMNSLWFWELGRRIERSESGWMLLFLTLGLGACSNLAQYFWSGPSIFGGLSGVLYGLLGYCWAHYQYSHTPLYDLPKGILGFMLVWLLLCLSGLVTTLSFGALAIANASHVAGLLVGCAAGAFWGYLSRARAS